MATQPQAPPAIEAQAQIKEQPRRVAVDLLDIIARTEANLQHNYAKQLIDAELARDLFDQDARLARVFSQSGIFGEFKDMTPEQALATAMTKIRLGRSWGLSEADSMQFVYFTNGRPAVMNEIIAAKMREAGFDWDLDFSYSQENGKKKRCNGCTLWLKKDGAPVLDRDGKPVSVSFTKDDADSAMIWERGKQIPLSSKWNFESWPEDMYFWRCVARVKRRYATDVMKGARLQEEAEESAPIDIAEHQKARKTNEEIRTEVLNRRLREVGARTETVEEHDARLERQMAEQAANQDKTTKSEQGVVQGQTATAAQPAGTEREIPGNSRHGSEDDLHVSERDLTPEENRALDAKLAAEEAAKAQPREKPVFGKKVK